MEHKIENKLSTFNLWNQHVLRDEKERLGGEDQKETDVGLQIMKMSAVNLLSRHEIEEDRMVVKNIKEIISWL